MINIILSALLGLILLQSLQVESLAQTIPYAEMARRGANQAQNQVDIRADYGAICDGIVDDTDALNTAFADAATYKRSILIPTGTCKFTSALTPLIGNDIRIDGYGSLSVLQYGGSSNAPGDLLTVGDGTTLYQNVSLKGFTIGSSTVLSSGTAVRIKKAVNIHVDLIVNGSGGNSGKLWDGIWLDQSSTINLYGSLIYTRNKGVTANQGSELHFNHAWIAGSQTPTAGNAIHIGGGYGGVYTENLTQQNNDIGLLIDTSISGTGNMQIFLGGTFDMNKTAGCYVNDGSTNPISKVIYANAWFASSLAGSGCVLARWQGGTFISSSGVFKNNASHGLSIDDPTVRVVLGPATDISDNRAYGVYSSFGINIQSSGTLHNNTKGPYSANVRH